jgi:uncharacterized membrane protein YuzA (DUF378 family)
MKKIIFFVLPLLFLPVSFYSQTTVTLTAPGTSTFTVPAGVTSLNVECWGAGGAGGGTAGNATAAGGGGGGGGYSMNTVGVVSGSSINYTIGAGAIGTTANGGNGGSTSFSTVSANGGLGGFRGNSNAGAGGAGGIGATYNGGNGANGILSNRGGGGGGSAGSASNGNSATNGTGAAAVTNGAAGGNGGVGSILNLFILSFNLGENGAAAGNPGGGGGGADNGDFGFLGFYYSGGNGGNGQIKVTYNCAAFNLTNTIAASVNVCAGNSSIITLNSTPTGLPIGLYTVAYEIQGVAQTPAVMNVSTAGIGTFIASGFTSVGTRTVRITRLSSLNCFSDIIENNLTTINVNSTLAAPTPLAGTGATCTQITANWNAVAGATYYELDVATDSAFTTFVPGYNALNVGNVVTRNITGLTAGVTYYYRVRVFNGTCISTNSGTITYATTIVPGAPTLNAVTNNTCSQFTVNWAAGTGTTNTYTIEWSTSASNFAAILGSATGITSLTYTITGLTNGVQYRYRIRAVNGCGSSANVTSGNVTTSGTAPGAPTLNAVTGNACTQFTVNWAAGTGTTNRYTIEWSTSVSNFATILGSATGITSLTYTITGLTNGVQYRYRIRAVNGCGSSANVTSGNVTTSGTVPGAPTLNAVTGNACTQFTVNWAAGTGTISSYTIEWSTSASNFTTIVGSATGITSLIYTITGLTNGVQYRYRIRAVNGCGSSANVTSGNITTAIPPDPPTITTADNIPFCQTDGATLTASAGTTYLWSTGETTSSIFVTTAGSYTVQVTNASGCLSNSSLPRVVTVQGLPTASAGGSQAICSNGTATISGASATNGTILWTHNGTGTLSNATMLTPTYTPATGDIGTTVILTMTVTSNNACAPQIATATYSIAVTAMPIRPTLGAVIHPTCSEATGNFSISNYDTSYTYAVTPSAGVSISGSVITAPEGTYTVTATVGACSSVPSLSINVNAQPTNIWDGTTWSSGSAPTISEKIVFDADYESTSDLIACSCQVNPEANVTIDSGNTLTVVNSLTVMYGGTLTFYDDASLIQINDGAVNSGTIIYERETTPLKQYDYTYWSSPVVSAPLSQLATNSLFYKFSPTINNWVFQSAATTMIPGVGYIGRAPGGLTYNPTQIVETEFEGVPNNGVISTPIIKSAGTYNLIGNPYPSAIDADLFITENSSITNGTLYFWTHNTAITNNVYTANDYAKYNLTGAVRTTAAAITGGAAPNGKIAAGQGFFIEANTSLANGTYSAIFENAMRVAGNNDRFFKEGAATTTNSISEGLERHRIWLSLRSSLGAYNQMLLGYVEGATNDFDSLFDGKTMSVGNSVSIYTMNGENNLAIQGKSLPYSETDTIPIGYSTTVNGELSIDLDDFDGVFTSQNIYLLDKTNDTLHDLKTAPYTFVTTSGNFNNRFELRFTGQTLGTTIPTVTDNDVKIITANHQLEVLSPATAISKVEVYDILGKLLFAQNDLNTNLFQTSSLQLATQILLVKVTLDNGQRVTKKIVID